MSFSQKVPACTVDLGLRLSFTYFNAQVMHLPNSHASHLCTCQKGLTR